MVCPIPQGNHNKLSWCKKNSENVTECITSKHQKTTDLAASQWITTPGIGLASFTSISLCEWWTNTLAGDWVTDMSRSSALRTLCSQTTQ